MTSDNPPGSYLIPLVLASAFAALIVCCIGSAFGSIVLGSC